MIVDCAVYENGHRKDGKRGLGEAFAACRGADAFVWLGLFEPTEEEFEHVRTEFQLHELAVEDALHAHQRPKLEVYGDTLLLVLKTVRYVDPTEVIETGEVLLFVSQEFVISVRHGDGTGLGLVRERIEGRDDLARLGPTGVVYAIVDHVVDAYQPAVDGVEIDIQEVEEQVFSAGRENPAARIFKLEREVLEFQRAVAPLVMPLDRLASGRVDAVPEPLHNYFRDVHDHLVRIAAQIDTHRQLLSSALQANLAQVTVRQNEDMRRISAWAAIIAVPTAIAGIYGMNFEHMPELEWTFGYPAAVGVMLAICVLLYRRLKRAGWL